MLLCPMCITEHLSHIETHLPLVCQLNKFIDIFLFHCVIRVSSSVAKCGIICKFRHFLTIFVSRSFIYIKNSSGPKNSSEIARRYTRCDWCPVAAGALLYDLLMHTRWQRPASQFRMHLAACQMECHVQ